MNTLHSLGSIISVTACLLATTSPGLNAADHMLSSQTRKELAQARQATAKYHQLSAALADGYEDIDLFIPGMGFHYVKFELVDGEFDPSAPEVLVYAPHPHSGHLRLVAVEYVVPIELSPTPPEGFAGDHDEWSIFGDLWTLHAWVWKHNPDGIFAPMNPLVD